MYPRAWFTKWAWITLAHSAAHAQSIDTSNAAYWYLRATEQYKAVQSNLTQEQRWSIEIFEGDPAGRLTPEIRLLLEKFRPVIESIDRGAALKECDFAFESPSDPFEHRTELGDLRNLARLLRHDVTLRLCDGDEQAAADRAVAGMRMGLHINAGRTLITRLVGHAIYSLGDSLILMMLDHGLLSVPTAQRLLAVIDSVPEDDPFGYRLALKQAPNDVGFFIADLETDQGRLRLLNHADWFVGDDLLAQMQLWATSDEDLHAALEKCEALAVKISQLAVEPDVARMKAALQEIAEQIKRGEHGPLASGMLGFCVRVPQQMEYVSKQLQERRALLKSVIAGDIDPRQNANAALLYERAIAMFSRFEAEQWRAIRQVADDGRYENAGMAATALKENSAIIVDLLRQASELKKCEFQSWQAVARHHAGMRNAARLLQADAALLLRDGKTDAAVDRLCIGLRMAAHLACDRSTMNALVAQAIVRNVDDLIAAGLDRNQFTQSHLAMVDNALSQLPRADHFGLAGAIGESREAWRQMFGKDWSWSEDKNETLIKRATAFVGRCTGDDFFWFALAQQEAIRDLPWQQLPSVTQYAPSLDDILALDVLGPALADVQSVRTIIDHNDFERLGQWPTPLIANIEQRVLESADVYRRIRNRIPERTEPVGTAGPPPSAQ